MVPFDRPLYDFLLVGHYKFCLAPFSSYLMLNNIVTLKSKLGVTQGHWRYLSSITVVKLYNDGVVQAVTFAYLIY